MFHYDTHGTLFLPGDSHTPVYLSVLPTSHGAVFATAVAHYSMPLALRQPHFSNIIITIGVLESDTSSPDW